MTKNTWTVLGDGKKKEKRHMPRFPYRHLIFRFTQIKGHTFEVKDLSPQGMRLSLREGTHNHLPESEITGVISWHTKELHIQGTIRWATQEELGLLFSKDSQKEIEYFFNVPNMAQDLRPLHQFEHLERPIKLKYWLSGNCPVDFFLWTHNDGAVASFQIVIFDEVVEWSDGQGLRTGLIIERLHQDTPLSLEDILSIEFDRGLEEQKVQKAISLVLALNSQQLEAETLKFIQLKLGKS